MLTKGRILVTRFPYQSRWGGEELHTLRLMQALDNKGFEAFFLGSDPVLLKAFRQKGFVSKRAWLGRPPVTRFTLLGFTLLSPILFFLAGFYLWLAKKRYRVDHLYALSLGEKLLMTPWARVMGIRVLWLEHARIGKWLQKNPWRGVYRRWSRGVQVLVTSKAMLPFLTPLAHHVTAIPCGVILDKEEVLPPSIVDFLKGGFAVGTVAGLTVDKGVDKVVRLVHSKPDIRLILVGDGPLAKTLLNDVPRERILLVPSLTRGELMSLYKALDLFILASTEMDPFGMVAAEAMWFGTPVVLTDVCGFARELKNGKEALVIPPKFAELDKAVKRLMRDEGGRRRMGEEGRRLVHSHFKFEKMVEEFVGVM